MDTLKIVGKYLFIYFDIYILQTLDIGLYVWRY